MDYMVSASPALKVTACNTDFSAEDYDLIAIPIDRHHLEHFSHDRMTMVFFTEEMHHLLVKQMQREDFKVEAGSVLDRICDGPNKSYRVAFFGFDRDSNADGTVGMSVKMQMLGAKIGRYAMKVKAKNVAIVNFLITNYPPKEQAEANKASNMSLTCSVPASSAFQYAMADIVLGCVQRCYHFSRYLTGKNAEKIRNKTVDSITVLTANTDPNIVESLAKEISEVNLEVQAVYLARDLVNEPANVLYPEKYAAIIKSQLSGLDVKVTILKKSDLEKLGMKLVLGVGMGSEKDPCVVAMEYNGNKLVQNKFDLALVGKGVTFDSGGLSIKPSKNMEDMKADMGGSAAVVGAMKLLASRKAKANIVGIVALVENSINGLAQRPGDIVESMSKQTVEILNTDAEGRLILADALHYVINKYSPSHVIDIATLTGAIVVALGHQYAGLFSNSDQLANALWESSHSTAEHCWRMPLGSAYASMMKSDIADLKNISGTGSAGSITAAQFLECFVSGCTSWAHVDAAGLAHDAKSNLTLSPNGGTGFGVRLFNEFVKSNLETGKLSSPQDR
jgi:leucyl aminopeptidase